MYDDGRSQPIRTIEDGAIGDIEGRPLVPTPMGDASVGENRARSDLRAGHLTVLKHKAGTIARQDCIFREGDPNHGNEPDTRQAERPRDWFLPAPIAADRELRKQARMFLYSHLFGPFIGNTVPLAFYLLSSEAGVPTSPFSRSPSPRLDYTRFVLRATGRYNLLTVRRSRI